MEYSMARVLEVARSLGMRIEDARAFAARLLGGRSTVSGSTGGRSGSGEGRRVVSVSLDADLLDKALRLTDSGGQAAMIERVLGEFVARESARRLADLGGTEPNIEPIRRQREDAHGLIGGL